MQQSQQLNLNIKGPKDTQNQKDEQLQNIEKAKQEQDQKQQFEDMWKKLNQLSQKAANTNNEYMSKFEQILQDEITQQIKNLLTYQKELKIFIVFMGTLSSGKSTFINSLLGQQLLPSKNQSCTSQVMYIGHQDTNAKQDTKITIDGQEFNSLEIASQELIKIQEESQQNFLQFGKPKMRAVNIKTQSHFHKTLNRNLRGNVFFIDTPGIELSKTTPEQYVKHFGQINQFIKLDEYSVRINLWVLNYTMFDSDKELQQNMFFMMKKEAEQFGKEKQPNQQQQQQQYILQSQFNTQIKPSSRMFYILNKYDQRNDEDDDQEQVLQNIQNFFQSDNIFRISAVFALRYNVMNHGLNQEEQNKFIYSFFKDNKSQFKFKNQDQAQQHCNQYIKNNEDLITDQDFNKFITQVSIEIKAQSINLFQYKLEKIDELKAQQDDSQKQLNFKEKNFKRIKAKIKLLKEEAEQNKNIKKISKFQQQIEQQIQQKIDIIEKCQNTSKIYIVFMGTLSAGKSTFINSLLGQQLLPSQYTSKVTFIGHQNTNDNQTKIMINEEEFDSIEKAEGKLIKIYQNPMGTVNIQTQSQFHLTCLRKDLQERVIFVDTSAIEISKTDPEQFVKRIRQINQLIQLDESSLRINLWILNFDSEVDELKQNILRIKNEVENNDLDNQQQECQDQIKQSASFFHIINKFDINKISETNPKGKEIKDHCNDTDNSFMISALDALSYNVMNYGTQDAQEKFIQRFYDNNKKSFNLIDEAKQHCQNPYLIELQDFNKFTSQLSIEIKKQLNILFEKRLQELKIVVAQLDQKKESMKEMLDINMKLKAEISNLQETFQSNLNNYEGELKKNNESFFSSVQELIDQVIVFINKNENQPVIEENCQKILYKIDQLFGDVTKIYTDKVEGLLKFETQVDPTEFQVALQICRKIINYFLQTTIPSYKKYFVLKQVEYVYDKMSIRSYRTFWEGVWSWMGFNIYKSSVPSGSVDFCASVAHYSSQDYRSQSIDKEKLKDQMKAWMLELTKEVESCIQFYSKHYKLLLECLAQIMNDFTN